MWDAIYETATGAGYAIAWILALLWIYSKAIDGSGEDDTDR